jgi:hypothetical protein
MHPDLIQLAVAMMASGLKLKIAMADQIIVMIMNTTIKLPMILTVRGL